MAIALSHHHHHNRRFPSSGGAAMRRLMSRWPLPAYILFSLLTLLAAAGCGRSAADRELDRVDAVMESDPELANAMLDSISPGRGADRARHALYRLVATGKLTGAVDNDSLLTLVADRYCTPDAPPSRDAMIANFYRGTAALSSGDIETAAIYLHQAEALGNVIPDTAYLCRICGNLAILYGKDFNGIAYIDYAKKAVEFGKGSPFNDDMDDMCRLAHAYTANNQDSLAWPIYEEVLKAYRNEHRDTDYAAVLQEYAKSVAMTGDFAKALPLIRKAYETSRLPAEGIALYAWMLEEAGYSGEADRHIQEAYSIQNPDDEMLWEFYIYSILIHRGDYKGALEISSRLSPKTEKTLSDRLEQNASNSHVRLLSGHNEELQKDRAIRKKIELMGLSIAVLVSTILAVVIIWIYTDSKKRRRADELMIRNMDNELLIARDRIEREQSINKMMVHAGRKNSDTLSRIIITNIDALITISNELNSKQENQKKYIAKTSDRLHEIAECLFEGEPPVLFSYINQLYDNVLEKIREDKPNVTESSLRILSLSLLGLSYSSISILTKCAYKTVAQSRLRLVKSLLAMDSPNSSLYDMLLNKSDEKR